MKPADSKELKKIVELATKRNQGIFDSRSEYPTDGTIYCGDVEGDIPEGNIIKF